MPDEDPLKEPHWTWDPEPSETLYDEGSHSCVRLFRDLWIKDDKVMLKVVGIGGVYTEPAERGKGRATSFLKMLLDIYLEDEDEVAAILFSKERSLYRGVGFVPIAHIGRRLLWARSLKPGVLIREGDWTLEPLRHF